MDTKQKELIRQIIEMLLYSPNYPHTQKIDLLNKASEAEINFGKEDDRLICNCGEDADLVPEHDICIACGLPYKGE